MKNTTIALALTLMIAPAAHAARFECAFMQDKYLAGKANDATCTMSPENTFATSSNPTPSRTALCNVNAATSYTEYRDFLIDTDKKTVTWDEYFGVIESVIPAMRRRYILEGKSETEANRLTRDRLIGSQQYLIASFTEAQNYLYWDERTKKPYDPPKDVKEYFLILKDGHTTLQLYIPEASGHAILSKYAGYELASWINMRFGQCRKTD